MRKKIVLFSVVLIIISIFITNYGSSRIIIKSIEDDNLSVMKNYCSVINKSLEEELRNGITPDYIRIAELFSNDINDRVTFIDKDGKVLADATLGTNYTNLENHKYRQEVKAALNGEIGVSTRKSGTFGKQFLYVAIPMYYQGDLIVVTRLAMELKEVAAIEQFIYKTSLISGLIGIAIAFILSFLFAGFIIKPVRSTIKLADNIIAGKYEDHVFINTKDELSILADKLSEISIRMSELDSKSKDYLCKSNSVFSNMKEAIIAVDNEFHLTMLNKSAKEMFHLTDDDIGEYLIRAIRNSDLLTAFKKVANEGYMGDQIIEFNKDETFKLRTEYIYQGDSNNIVGIIALIEDISGLDCSIKK